MIHLNPCLTGSSGGVIFFGPATQFDHLQPEGKPPVTLKAGDVLFIPAGTIHSAKNVGSGNAAELATYLVENGKPLLTLAK